MIDTVELHELAHAWGDVLARSPESEVVIPIVNGTHLAANVFPAPHGASSHALRLLRSSGANAAIVVCVERPRSVAQSRIVGATHFPSLRHSSNATEDVLDFMGEFGSELMAAIASYFAAERMHAHAFRRSSDGMRSG